MDVRLVCVREYGALAEELRDKGVPVELIPLKSRLDPRGIVALARFMKREGTDVVHAHMYRASVPGTIAARLAKVPVVFSQVHNVGTWESSRQAALDRFLCRWRTGVFCVSQAVQQDVCRTLKLSPERAPVLYNGIDTEAFRPDDALRKRTREALGIDGGTVVLLVPARLHSQKNPLGVLAAFKAALKSTSAPALLLYAGAGPMEAELTAAVEKEGLGAYVRLLGRRDDMAALYNASDAVVLSSFKEGFSNAVLEALACGRPVIAADVGGNREALDLPSTGWLHAPGDGEALRAQFEEALIEGRALGERAAACRERALRFSLDRMLDETVAHYRTAYEKAKRA